MEKTEKSINESAAKISADSQSKKESKKYKTTDAIPCISITSGELGMEGIKSHINYRWAERGDVTEVEYQDLLAAIRQNDSFVVKPYFVIQDDELVSQFPQLKKIYDSMYSGKDLQDLLKLTPSSMKAAVLTLPDGAKESIKNIAATQISSGQLDSVKKIKILDEIFGTEMALLTGLFK